MPDSAPTETVRPAASETLVPTNEALTRKFHSGANWLYWIAGISAVNVILTHVEATIRFSLGLAISEVVYAIGRGIGGPASLLALTFDLLILGLVAGVGVLANRAKEWAFILGMVIMVADTVLIISVTGFEMILAIALHLYAAVSLWFGYSALRKLKQRQELGQA